MAREHLYKAKRKDNGEWVFGDLLHPDIYGNGYAIEDFTTGKNNCFDIDENTNLKDKNGTKVFEGDILAYIGAEWTDVIGAVEYDTTTYIDNTTFAGWRVGKVCEEQNSLKELAVIGNIFDNPELLEV